jgi:hypothetical protein
VVAPSSTVPLQHPKRFRGGGGGAAVEVIHRGLVAALSLLLILHVSSPSVLLFHRFLSLVLLLISPSILVLQIPASRFLVSRSLLFH